MFRVTVDVFSGRPNPTWILDNEDEARQLLTAIAQDPAVAAKPGSGFQGLGYRGIRINLLGDDTATEFKLPATFTITDGSGEDPRKGVEIAARLIEGMTRYGGITLPEHATTPLDQELQQLLLEQLREFERNPPHIPPKIPRAPSSGIRVTVSDDKCQACMIELSRFNPAFWNTDPYVRSNNNCYNYARNWRTDTFAQPGRAHRCYPYPMACPDVVHAALCDGLHKRCDCLPDSEYPRRFMALVVWPGGDYHWYRKQKGGFWGHKPGGTAAKNFDNSGALITNPETCDRGGYTDFCGYFYAGKSVTII